MSFETMLLTIAIPAFRRPAQLAVMMLRYKKGQQAEIIESIQSIRIAVDTPAEDVMELVEAGLGDSVELMPIRTIGCFCLECE